MFSSMHIPSGQLGIQITDSCSVGCRHCAPECIPEQPQKTPQIEVIRALLEKSRDSHELKSVVISGGEPFDRLSELQKLCSIISSFGIDIIIHTSGNWAGSESKAIHILNSLTGLKKLLISIDQYHQEKVSWKNINTVIDQCRGREIRNVLVVRAWSAEDDPFINEMKNNLTQENINHVDFDIEGIILAGRATQSLMQEEEKARGKKIEPGYMLHKKQNSWKEVSHPCQMCQRPVIDTDMVLSACCNYKYAKNFKGLNLGTINMSNPPNISEAIFQDGSLAIIRNEGPLELAKRKAPDYLEEIIELTELMQIMQPEIPRNCILCSNALGYVTENV